MEKLTIEIWSDVSCPFCFLGKRILEKAIQNLGVENHVEILWRSFQLDPTIPENYSKNAIQYLSEAKGYAPAQVRDMTRQLEGLGNPYNIDFNFEKALSVNTFKMHELLQWAKNKGKASLLKEGFISAYFSKGIDLSKEENLMEIVAQTGLDPQEAKFALTSKNFVQAVKEDITSARQMGIRGVPFFLINQNLGISGIKDEKTFEAIITKALNEIQATATNIEGQSCAVDGDGC